MTINLNNAQITNLPYVFIPELNAKFLLDTGSNRSLIDPELANRHFRNFMTKEMFQIETAHGLSHHNEIINITLPKIFKNNGKHKFYLFKFSPKFDGLIGIDLINQLKAKIDMENKILTTPQTSIPIIFQPKDNENSLNNNPKGNNIFKNFSLTIDPMTEKIVKIPVNQCNGMGILKKQNFGKNVETPYSVVNVINNFAITTIKNLNKNPITLNFEKPLDIEPLNLTEINFVEKIDGKNNLEYEQDTYLKENLRNLRLNHTNQEENDKIRKLCFEFRDIFYCDRIPLTFTNQIRHRIKLKDESPIYTKSYRYPEVHKNEIKNQIEKMLDQGIIQHSNSPFSAPVWIVPKKADASGKKKWRLVIDYRKLNEQTIDDKYPIPNITDILDKLGKCQYFTTLDLSSGFHQIEMDTNDVPKTAFTVENGHYEFLRMSFGLKNAPATFQRTMDNILRGIPCLVYVDDIIVFSVSLQEHLEKLRQVFQRLRDANFKIQLDKSEFLKREVAYLGHVITPNGVKPNPDKIKAVLKYPIPKSTKEIKGFLGLVGYYRKFIKDFAKITKPLTVCLKKGREIKHTPEFINAFQNCQQILTNDPILQYPDFSKPFILTTDASNVALGAILSQGSIGSDLPIAYASRTLNESEQNYSTVEKELLAIVYATKYFRPYLYGRKFTIITDHKPLTYLFNLKEPNSKLIRWKLRLEEYDYNVVYKKGILNSNADALSRIRLNILNTFENESTINNPGDVDENVLKLSREEHLEPIEITPSTSNSVGKNRIKILSDIQIKPPNVPTENTPHSNFNETTNNGIPILDEAVDNKPNQIIVLPSPDKIMNVTNNNYEHLKINILKIPKELNKYLILKFLQTYTTSDKTYHMYFHTDKLYQDFCQVYLKNFSERGPKLIRCTKRLNLIREVEEQLLLIRNHHEGKTNHRGINETLEYLKRNYFWKNMKNDVTNYINSCNICQTAKYARKKAYVPLVVTETPSRPFQILHMDIFIYNKTNYLTIIDSFTKLAQAFKIISRNAIEISKHLIQYFNFYGTPEKIVCDNGGEFKNEVVQEMLNLHKIEIHFTTPAHHDSNGVIERLHSTLIEHLRILQTEHPNDDNLMQYAILGYNNTIHSVTGFTPFELTFGHSSLRDNVELFLQKNFYQKYVNDHKEKTNVMYDNLEKKLKETKIKIVDKINLHGDVQNTFKLGQEVFKINNRTRNKKENKFIGPYTITLLLPNNKAEIVSHKNQKSEIIHLKELRTPHLISGTCGQSQQTN